jgi:DNA-binding transcriptional regulator GbsR (MarR family)
MGDRRDHFESMKDPWEMFRVVLDERKKREIDPTLVMLRDALAELEAEKQKDAYTAERLRSLQDFFETTSAWYNQVKQWPTPAIVKFIRLGDKVLKVLG